MAGRKTGFLRGSPYQGTESDIRRTEQWHKASGLPLKKFFTTSGQLYKSMNLTDKLPDMSEEEQYSLLASDGMLVKRPILVGTDFVLVGFKEMEWEEKL